MRLITQGEDNKYQCGKHIYHMRYLIYWISHFLWCIQRAYGKVKMVKFILEQTMNWQRGSRGILYSFFNHRARWGGWSTPRPGSFAPGKETQRPFYRKPQGRFGCVLRISYPPGLDPRAVQSVASRCTDWATPAHFIDVDKAADKSY